MKARFRRLHVQALDLQATRRFYHELLALPDAPGGPERLRFVSGETEILFAREQEADEIPAPLNRWVAEFEVTDLDRLVRRLREVGSYIVEEPGPDRDGGRRAVVLDPNGHQILLRQSED